MKNLLFTFVLMAMVTTAFGQSEVFSKSSEAIQGYDQSLILKKVNQ